VKKKNLWTGEAVSWQSRNNALRSRKEPSRTSQEKKRKLWSEERLKKKKDFLL